MKPLFVPIFSVLTAAVYADPYVLPPVHYSNVPMSKRVTYLEAPMYSVPNTIVTIVPDTVYTDWYPISEHSIGERIIPFVPHTVTKPTEAETMEMAVALPPPLAPLLPIQDLPLFESEIIRGQTNSVEDLPDLLDSPLPIPMGSVEDGTIDPKLTGDTDSSESDIADFAADWNKKSEQAKSTGQETRSADPLGYTMLLTAMAITTIGLVYMAFVAYDYRQRWMQSLVAQNDRYLVGGTFDMEMEDTYSGSLSFSEGLGLTHRSV